MSKLLKEMEDAIEKFHNHNYIRDIILKKVYLEELYNELEKHPDARYDDPDTLASILDSVKDHITMAISEFDSLAQDDGE